MTSAAILDEIGERLMRRRVERDMTQAELAKRAGVGKRTLERLEAGESTQLGTFIKILKELGLVEEFLGAIPEAVPGPMEMLKANGAKPRTRVRHPKKKAITAEGGILHEPEVKLAWTWGDDAK